MRNRLIWAPLIVFVLLGSALIYGLERPKDDYVQSQMVGQKLPAFAMPAATPGISGLNNTDFANGKPRLLNIFASWCLPCRAEAPNLEMLSAEGVEIYGIALRDKPEDVAAFLKEYGNPYGRIGADKDMRIQLMLGSSGVPETYIIGGDGTIIYQHIGDIREEHVPMLLAKIKAAK
jgi:cytochrome c biogenesis protein CcmG, thiol:disulfide interchange protein DsbE